MVSGGSHGKHGGTGCGCYGGYGGCGGCGGCGGGQCAVAHRAMATEATVAAGAAGEGGAPLRTAGYGPGRRRAAFMLPQHPQLPQVPQCRARPPRSGGGKCSEGARHTSLGQRPRLVLGDGFHPVGVGHKRWRGGVMSRPYRALYELLRIPGALPRAGMYSPFRALEFGFFGLL